MSENASKQTTARACELLSRIAALPAQASPHLPAVQLSALMLRMCGTGKLTHMLRSAPPRATQEAARRYDQALLASYVKITGLDDLTEQEALHCQLPMRMGGRGLRSQEKIANAAWLASWAQSLSEVILRTNVTSLASLDTCALPIAGHCREAFEAIPPAAGIDDTSDPLDWRRWALAPQKKV